MTLSVSKEQERVPEARHLQLFEMEEAFEWPWEDLASRLPEPSVQKQLLLPL